MDYAKIAGDVLFGGKVLDNAIRGLFIEALTLDALHRHDREEGFDPRWLHAGAGWGPWDLQRGTAKEGSRVRVQVKTKASKQLWKPKKERKPKFSLGLSKSGREPEYFARHFSADVYGACEPDGYRTDFMLLAWHDADNQADPHQYRFYIVPVSRLWHPDGKLAKDLTTARVFADFQATNFGGLAKALNEAADQFLTTGTTETCAGSSGAV